MYNVQENADNVNNADNVDNADNVNNADNVDNADNLDKYFTIRTFSTIRHFFQQKFSLSKTKSSHSLNKACLSIRKSLDQAFLCPLGQFCNPCGVLPVFW